MRFDRIAAASAVATLLALGLGEARAEGAASEAAKIKCEGVNECKGHSSCKSVWSECAGKNSCAGKGFKMLTAEECEAAKAKMKEERR
jgi:uncharacterized membrane protein